MLRNKRQSRPTIAESERDNLTLSDFAIVGLLWAFCSLLCPITAHAANHYIRPGATGNGSGADWTNAFATFPTSFVRGDTYYIADGAYTGARTFNTPLSGTNYIFIKKAIPSAHGADTGWDPAYGDGVAAFSGQWTFTSGYWDIDGVTGGGPGTSPAQWPGVWTTGHGISQTVGSGGRNVDLTGTNSQTHFNFRHIKFINGTPVNYTGTAAGSTFRMDVGGTRNASNVLIEYCYVPAYQGPVFWAWGGHDWIIQYTYFEGNGVGNDSNVHRELWSAINNDRWTWRWNYILNINNSAVWAYVNEGDLAEGIEIYGNVVDANPNGESAGRVIDADPGLVTNWRFFNNTIVGWNGGCPCVVTWSGSTIISRNNILANHPSHNYGPGWEGTASHNSVYNLVRTGVGDVTASWATVMGSSVQTFSSDPFINFAPRDLRLKAATQAGSSTDSPAGNAVDMFGNVRGADGVWDRGALEFGSSPSGSACDINNNGSTNVNDVQLCANQAIGVSPCLAAGQSGSADINRDGSCNVVDVQRVVNNALGGQCVTQ